MPGAGGGHSVALLERPTSSDPVWIPHCPASLQLRERGCGLGGADRGSPEGKIFSEREKSHPHTEKAKSHLREGFCQQRGCARNFGRAFNFTPGLAKGKNSRLYNPIRGVGLFSVCSNRALALGGQEATKNCVVGTKALELLQVSIPLSEPGMLTETKARLVCTQSTTGSRSPLPGRGAPA